MVSRLLHRAGSSTGRGAGDGAVGRRLRVLAAPASSGVDGNPYIDALYAAVGSADVQVAAYDRARLLTRPDVVHVHWPVFLLRRELTGARAVLDAARVLALLALARARGAVLVVTAHNLPDDAQGAVPRMFVAAVLAMTDHVISLSAAAVPALLAASPELRGTPVTVVPHGHYRDAYPTPPAVGDARARLGLPASGRVLLCLGQIRLYKALAPLVEEFLTAAGPVEVLAVVGEPVDTGEADRLQALAARDARVHLDLRRIPSGEVAIWHAAADVVVVAHRAARVLNSGAALLALSLGRPFVAADSPVLRELDKQVGAGWVLLTDGTPRALVAAARTVALPPAGPDLTTLDWPGIGRRTVAVYRAAVVARRR